MSCNKKLGLGLMLNLDGAGGLNDTQRSVYSWLGGAKENPFCRAPLLTI